MPRYGWLLDPKKCIECRACEAACKQWNGLEPGIRFRQVKVTESGRYPQVRMQALSLACNHCDNPYCQRSCPTDAIQRHRGTGAIVIHQDKCTGCGLCALACPYGVPQFNAKTEKMMKCTMCYDRIEDGLQPACATLCPTGALQFGPWSEIEHGGNAEHEGFFNPVYTRPAIRFVREGFPGHHGG